MLLVVLAVLLAIKDSGFDLRDHSPSVEAKMAKFRAAGRTGRTEWARGAAGFGSAEAAVLEIDQSHPEPKHGDAQGHGMHAPTVTAHSQTWDKTLQKGLGKPLELLTVFYKHILQTLKRIKIYNAAFDGLLKAFKRQLKVL